MATNAIHFAGTDFEVVSRINFPLKTPSSPPDSRRFGKILVLARLRVLVAVFADDGENSVHVATVVADALKLHDVVAVEYRQQQREVERRRRPAFLLRPDAMLKRFLQQVLVQICRHVVELERFEPGRGHNVGFVRIKQGVALQ
ncbi:MAG: hypothetical protein KF762_17230 [Acidobacteria bacterium]|nr:hypothetical protein [Acidobacteriota bacterium]